MVTTQELVFTLGVQQSQLWRREQREEGRRSLNTRHLQRLGKICPAQETQSPNSAPAAACLRTLPESWVSPATAGQLWVGEAETGKRS